MFYFVVQGEGDCPIREKQASRLKCNDRSIYVDQTDRSLNHRLIEYEDTRKYKQGQSFESYQHLITSDHRLNFQNAILQLSVEEIII